MTLIQLVGDRVTPPVGMQLIRRQYHDASALQIQDLVVEIPDEWCPGIREASNTILRHARDTLCTAV
jgi:hypothetical protein